MDGCRCSQPNTGHRSAERVLYREALLVHGRRRRLGKNDLLLDLDRAMDWLEVERREESLASTRVWELSLRDQLYGPGKLCRSRKLGADDRERERDRSMAWQRLVSKLRGQPNWTGRRA